MVVTPPCMVESIQPSWPWRGVQSPNTGCTWLSIRPGATQVRRASMTVFAPSRSRVLLLAPVATIRPSFTTMVVGVEDGLVDVAEQQRPMFWMTTLPDFPLLAISAISCCPRRGGSVVVLQIVRAHGAQHGLDHEVFPVPDPRPATPAARREGRERVAVGGVEIAGGRDQQVDVARHEVLAEQPWAAPLARISAMIAAARDEILARAQRLRDVRGLVQVLGVEQRHELGGSCGSSRARSGSLR